MNLEKLMMVDFKGFEEQEIELNGKSTVIFGINGSGKSSILSAICYLCWNWLNRLNNAQGNDFKSLNENLIHSGSDSMEISAIINLDEAPLELKKGYKKGKPGKPAVVESNKKLYDQFVERWLSLYEDDESSLPVFIYYGTNRSVLDIPLRIRNKHEFTKWTALERAIENKLDYRTFFEWFRNQEDYEAEMIRTLNDLKYRDPKLTCVKTAVQSILPNISDLKVKRNPPRLCAVKNGREFSVDQLSDGEKCTLALVGDIARRLALANQSESEPLKGKGIVLIDEIELHMHPQWQRMILPGLKRVFPNIQWIITTHSPQVLGEVNGDFQLLYLEQDEDNRINLTMMKSPMYGLSSDFILENYMDTPNSSPEFLRFVQDTEEMIDCGQFQKAKVMIDQITETVGRNYPVVFELLGNLRRAQIIYEKNHKKQPSA